MGNLNPSLKTLFLFNAFFVFAGSLLGPLYAIYVENISNNVSAITISWSVFLFSTTLFSYIVAKIGDKIKEKEYFLMTGYGIRAFVWFSFMFIDNFYGLILAQIILGIGEAFGTPSYDALFAEHLDRGKHIYEYSEWKILSNIVLGLGTLLGGIIVTQFGFNLLFMMMSIIAAISFVGIYLKPRNLL